MIFRKRRADANFSIEASFKETLKYLHANRHIDVREFVSTHLSIGVVPRLRALWELRRQRAEVYHITGDIHFLVLGLPGKKTLLTIHDLGFLERGSHPLSRWLLKKLWLDWPVQRARMVSAVSDATRLAILQRTGCPPSKVVTIPTLVSDTDTRKSKVFNRERPQILHIGLAPNKNFHRHVLALAGLRCTLQIIGPLNEAQHAHLRQHQIDYRADTNLPLDAMQRAYEACDVLLFASTLEGFGMPIIEAQTVGRVVVTSGISSMPEIAGGAACLVDPYQVASIRAGLERVIHEEDYRESLITAGYRNVQRFTGQQVAQAYAQAYEKIAAGGDFAS